MDHELEFLRQLVSADPRKVTLALGQVRPEHFVDIRHAQIFKATQRVVDERLGISPESIGYSLDAMGAVPAAKELLRDVFNRPNSASLEIALRAFRGKSLSARFVESTKRLKRFAEWNDDSIPRRLRSYINDVHKLLAEYSTPDRPDSTEVFERVAAADGTPQMGILTGFETFDRKTGALHRGHLTVLGARPGQGKSAFAQNMVMNALIRDEKLRALIVSLEMSPEELVRRIAGQLGGVSQTGYMRGVRNREAFDCARKLYPGKRFTMSTAPRQTVWDIVAQARYEKHTNGLDILVVDYLQLITATDERTREREVARMSSELLALAKELNIAVILVSQLNRGSQANADKKPELHHLRDSGQIEQDAVTVGLLYHPTTDEGPDRSVVFCDLAKTRNAPPGTEVRFRWQGDVMRFTEMAFQG